MTLKFYLVLTSVKIELLSINKPADNSSAMPSVSPAKSQHQPLQEVITVQLLKSSNRALISV